MEKENVRQSYGTDLKNIWKSADSHFSATSIDKKFIIKDSSGKQGTLEK